MVYVALCMFALNVILHQKLCLSEINIDRSVGSQGNSPTTQESGRSIGRVHNSSCAN